MQYLLFLRSHSNYRPIQPFNVKNYTSQLDITDFNILNAVLLIYDTSVAFSVSLMPSIVLSSVSVIVATISIVFVVALTTVTFAPIELTPRRFRPALGLYVPVPLEPKGLIPGFYQRQLQLLYSSATILARYTFRIPDSVHFFRPLYVVIFVTACSWISDLFQEVLRVVLRLSQRHFLRLLPLCCLQSCNPIIVVENLVIDPATTFPSVPAFTAAIFIVTGVVIVLVSVVSYDEPGGCFQLEQ